MVYRGYIILSLCFIKNPLASTQCNKIVMQTNHEGGGRAFHSFCSLFALQSVFYLWTIHCICVFLLSFHFLIIPYPSTLVLLNLFILYNLKSDILVPSCLFILISLYPCIRVPLKPWIPVFFLVSVYPSLISYILVSFYSFLYPYTLVFLSLYPCILVS